MTSYLVVNRSAEMPSATSALTDGGTVTGLLWILELVTQLILTTGQVLESWPIT